MMYIFARAYQAEQNALHYRMLSFWKHTAAEAKYRKLQLECCLFPATQKGNTFLPYSAAPTYYL